MSFPLRLARIALSAALVAAMTPAVGEAQSLRGSRESIDRMYDHALAERFTFFETPASVRRQVASGRLIRLRPDGNFRLHRVGFPYARSATATFVKRLAAQQVAECGERLVVTSAVRPATRQPANSADRSVHPTGMAIDLRKPTGGACLRWMRNLLLELEGAGVLEATEEWSPPHFHVAVYSTPYRRYVASRGKAADSGESPGSTESPRSSSEEPRAGLATYVVRRGDTLWSIARKHDTTVDAITSENGLVGRKIVPGQELRIPAGS